MRITRRTPHSNNKEGFTLVEILIVSVIFSIAALAVFATFSSGLKIWKRVYGISAGEDVVIFLDRLGREARSCFKFKGIDFRGNREELSFATFTAVGPAGGRFAEVSYGFDESGRTLWRQVMGVSDIYRGNEPARRVMLSGVAHAGWRYYCFNEEQKQYIWQEECPAGKLPLAIRLDLEFLSGEKLTRTFTLKAARRERPA